MEKAKKGSGSSGSLVHLSVADMRRLAKPRAGFEPFAEQLIALAQKKAALRGQSFDADEALAELRAYQELQTVVAKAVQQLEMAQATRLLHASNVWRVVLRIYQRAEAVAPDDADVRYAIAAFEAFMKNGARKRRTPTTPSTPSTPATP